MPRDWSSRDDINLNFDLRLSLTENEPQTKLYKACVEGSKIDIDECLIEGEDVNAYNVNGYTPLHGAVLAAGYHAEEIIDMLINNGADVNKVSIGDQNTALHLAVERHPFEIAFPLAIKLVNCNVDKTIRNRKLRTPYDICLAREFNKIARYLDDDEGVDTDQARSSYLNSMGDLYGPKLVNAVMNSDYGEIKTCLENNAKPNVINEHGAGAIHYAVTHCTLPRSDILKLLLDSGADVNLKDYEGDTPLNLTIKSKLIRDSGDMPEIVTNLMDWGADVTCQDLDGNDAVELARIRGYQDIEHILTRYTPKKTPGKMGPNPGKYSDSSGLKDTVTPRSSRRPAPTNSLPQNRANGISPEKTSPRKTPYPRNTEELPDDIEQAEPIEPPKRLSPRKPAKPEPASGSDKPTNVRRPDTETFEDPVGSAEEDLQKDTEQSAEDNAEVSKNKPDEDKATKNNKPDEVSKDKVTKNKKQKKKSETKTSNSVCIIQ